MHIVIHDYAGHPFQAQLSRELAKRGNTVTHAFGSGLLTPQGNLTLQSGDPMTLEFLPVSLHPEYRKFKYSFRKRRAMEIAYGRDLVCALSGRDIDVVLSGNMPSEPQRILQRYCQRKGIRFVPWIQDFYGIAVDRLVRRKIPLLGALVGAYYKGTDRRIHRTADRIVVITDDFVPLLQKDGINAGKVKTIPNWASLDELPLRPKSNSWSQQHDLDESFVFLYSGTLAMKHNPALLRDLAVAMTDQAEVKVVVVSEGPGRKWLESERERLSLQNLELFGFQPFAQMPEVLASADVLVAVLEPDAGVFSVPSKVLSYLCAARAILLAVPGANLAARLVREECAGLTVEPNDSQTFLNHARNLLRDESSRFRFGQNARRYAETHFDIEVIASQFEEVLCG